MAAAADEKLYGLGWFDDEGDDRGVTLGLRSDGTAWVGECTEGDATEFVYETRRHEHRVMVRAEQLAAMLGVPAGDGEGLAGHMRGLFDDGGFLLSDLMDNLDRAGLAYRYLSCGEGVAAMRPAG